MNAFDRLWQLWNGLVLFLMAAEGYSFLIPMIWRRRLEPESFPKFRKVLLLCGSVVLFGQAFFPVMSQILYAAGDWDPFIVRNTVWNLGVLGLIMYLTQRYLKKLPAREITRRQAEEQGDM